ncbi:MAG: hypothetical protein K0R61_1104 [Microvirga sp.]|nr:hypothetical protein [Microvirga sp.]
MTALFFVRAEVADPGERDAFDRWYEHEHLPQAAAAFQVVRAWRGWSEVDPAIHYAFYELADLTAAQAILNSEDLKGLIAEFDRVWGTRVTRTREVVVTRQLISA